MGESRWCEEERIQRREKSDDVRKRGYKEATTVYVMLTLLLPIYKKPLYFSFSTCISFITFRYVVHW